MYFFQWVYFILFFIFVRYSTYDIFMAVSFKKIVSQFQVSFIVMFSTLEDKNKFQHLTQIVSFLK